MSDFDTDPPRKPRLRHLLAGRLRDLRRARHWSQEDLAEASGMHRTYIGLIERAECGIGIDKLERLAAAFSISVAELVRDPADVPAHVPWAKEPRLAYVLPVTAIASPGLGLKNVGDRPRLQ